MKRFCLVVALGLLTVTLCDAQSDTSANAPTTAASATQATSNPESEIKGAFPTTLVKAIDSKKLKVGDTVVCQTVAALHSRSGLMIPSGAKVFGRVTQAQARSKGDPASSLAIVFEKIQWGKDKELPMKGTLQAVGPNLGDNEVTTGPASPGTLGGRGGGAATTPPPSDTAVAGPNAGIHPLNQVGSHPLLNAESHGVVGLKNLEMDKDNVLTSSGKEVKLENGTQMLVHAEIEIPVK